MSKRRKILIIFGLAFVAFFVGWPTVHALIIRGQVSNAIKQAELVRLEEFAFGVSLTTVELPREQWSEVTAHLPVVPDIGVPGSVKLCFIPHHRIVVTGPNQEQMVFTVCFGCDQATLGNSGIFALPYLWSGPLRDLFMSHQIHLRSDREYTSAAFKR